MAVDFEIVTREPTKIVTRCPACGNQTLFIGSGGHLTCSWLGCPSPSLERAIEEIVEAARAVTNRITEVYRPEYVTRCERTEPDSLLALVAKLRAKL